jgi:hypothetical protein
MKINNLSDFLLLALSFNAATVCMQVRHGAFIDNLIIDCPFEYKEGLSDEEKSLLTQVFERGQTVIDTAKKELALVTPAHPCIAAFAKRPQAVTQKEGKKDLMWVGHLHYSNRVSEVPKEIEGALALETEDSKADLMVSLFSREMGAEFTSDGWRPKHGDKSQEEHMLLIKDTIVNYFEIDDNQVQTCLFKSNQDCSGTDYALIDRSIFVDGSEANNAIKLYSISPGHEGIVPNFIRFKECSFDFTKKAYGRIWMSPYIMGTIWQYNSVLLKEVPKYNVADLNVVNVMSTVDPYIAVYSPQDPLNRRLILGSSLLKGVAGGLAIAAVGFVAGRAVSKIVGTPSPYLLKYT